MQGHEQPSRKPVIGCVSFLNARPLIDTLDTRDDLAVRFDVPSGLLDDLNAGEMDVALCPVIDYQRSARPLAVLPVGGIGCDGHTFTVRLFSRVPLDEVAQVHADTDSHTSVALMQVILDEVYGNRVEVIDLDAREHVTDNQIAPPIEQMEAVLLIGDKVVTDAPPEGLFEHQLDLGAAWHGHTGLPFVFAVWMCHADADLGDLPEALEQTRLSNADQIDAIVKRHAAARGWPADLARQYLGHWLRFKVGQRQLEAIRRFHAAAHRLGLVDELRSLRIYDR